MHRHLVYRESSDYERLAVLASGTAAQRLKLPLIPAVHFFKEDPAGKFARPTMVAGFIDNDCSPACHCVFIRGGLSAAESVATVFHEVRHVAQHEAGELADLPAWQREQQADLFALRAPDGTFEEIMAKLSREYRQPTPAELKSMDLELFMRERRAGFEAERQRLRFEESTYRMTHSKEIAAEAEAKRKREIAKSVESYLLKSANWHGTI